MKQWQKRQSIIASDNFQGKVDIAEIIAKACLSCGFTATGVPLRKFGADYFEKTKFLEHYINYLEEHQDRGCEQRRKYSAVLSDLVRTLKPSTNFLAGTVLGVPGCGKTTLLLTLKKTLRSALLVFPQSNLRSVYRSVENAFYLPEILLVDTPLRFDTVLVDEYTKCESAEILLLQRKVCATRVILFGDRSQGDCSSLISPEWLTIPCVFEKNKSHRFGKNTSDLLKTIGLSVESCSNTEDSVSIDSYEGEVPDADQYLCLSERTRRDLEEEGIGAQIVSEKQGSESDSVVLFIAEWDESYCDLPTLLVGLTRHRKNLTIKKAENIDLSNFAEKETSTDSYV